MPEHQPDRDVTRAQSELGRLQAQISTLKVTESDLRSSVGRLRNDAQRQEADLAARIKSSREREQEALTGLRQAHEELTQTNAELQKVLAEHGRYRERVASAKADLARLDEQIAEAIAKSESETQAEARLVDLQAVLTIHEKAIVEQQSVLQGFRDESLKLAGDIERARADRDRKAEELRVREDEQSATALLLNAQQVVHGETHEKLTAREQKLTHLKATLEQQDAELTARERALAEAQKAQEREATRQAQERQLLDRLTDETAKTHSAAQEALQNAETARGTTQAEYEALRARQREIEASSQEAMALHEQLETRAVQLEAKEQALRTASLKLAGTQAELKAAIARQSLESAGIVVPEVPGMEPPRPKRTRKAKE